MKEEALRLQSLKDREKTLQVKLDNLQSLKLKGPEHHDAIERGQRHIDEIKKEIKILEKAKTT